MKKDKPTIWRMQLKPSRTRKPNITYQETLEFCKTKGIIGLGWLDFGIAQNEKELSVIKELALSKEGSRYLTGMTNIDRLREIKVDDLIWTRLPENDSEYYLCKVVSLWDERDVSFNDELVDHDVGNYVGVIWQSAGDISNVPGKVMSSMAQGRTLQRINDITNLSMYIWNHISGNEKKYETNDYSFSDFWNDINPEELETLVMLYLQKEKQYHVYTSTFKKFTAKIEGVLVHDSGKIISYIQVKSNESLDVENYIDLLNHLNEKEEQKVKIFLFTTSENYGNKKHKDIDTSITKHKLEEFMLVNKNILPGNIKILLNRIENNTQN